MFLAFDHYIDILLSNGVADNVVFYSEGESAHVVVAGHRPQSNGIAEFFVCTLKGRLVPIDGTTADSGLCPPQFGFPFRSSQNLIKFA
jgi:hypothetical protein